jgi:hypothetical protein
MVTLTRLKQNRLFGWFLLEEDGDVEAQVFLQIMLELQRESPTTMPYSAAWRDDVVPRMTDNQFRMRFRLGNDVSGW